ncbi:MAG: AmmeMemoRadiSam system protein B [Candidatus Woesearchaeota archaeon]
MRTPIANKTHYASGMISLDKQLQEAYEGERGPGTIPLKADKVNLPVKAIIVPHAPMNLAGACSAWAYKELAENNDITTYFIIAQPQFSEESGTTMETFEMPFGEVRVDQNIVRELVKKGNIKLNDELHAKENLIEVQLPFLQHINKNRMEKIKIVPLLLNSDINFGELSVDIKEVLMEQGKEAVFIFVSNLTSYGRNFHFVPFTEDIIKNIVKIDKSLIDAIQKDDEEGFFQVVDETMVPLTGFYAFKLYFKLITPKKITLEQNYLSGDVNNDYKNCVSYASFVVR